MNNLIQKRTSNLRGFGGAFLIIFWDFLLFFLAYKNMRLALIFGLILYLFLDKIIITSTKDKISFHVYNGILKVLKNMQNRKSILGFYVFIISLSYVLSLYLISIQDIAGFISFALIILLKVIVYFMCYRLSKNS
ncbi:MAG: hypothetical protein LBH40_03640 [Alphaproteobacteria bacterium]|jgi:hypothetical protein|nr:hypothetical protein [Alphaproteobacteria bacterium]